VDILSSAKVAKAEGKRAHMAKRRRVCTNASISSLSAALISEDPVIILLYSSLKAFTLISVLLIISALVEYFAKIDYYAQKKYFIFANRIKKLQDYVSRRF